METNDMRQNVVTQNDVTQNDVTQNGAARNAAGQKEAGRRELRPNGLTRADRDLLDGVAEMRSVGERLLRWAERLERSVWERKRTVSAQDAAPAAEAAAVPEPAAEGAAVPEPAAEAAAVPEPAAAPEPAVEAAAAPAAAPEAPAPVPGPAPAPEADQELPLTFEALRGALAFICAAGYSAEVKGLIAGCGASRLNQVPEEKWPELLAAAKRLGNAGKND